MKKIIYSALFALTGFGLNAQYHVLPYVDAGRNPLQLNNDQEQTAAYLADFGWTSIQATSATPVWSPAQTIPFAFSFNGNAETSYKVSTSGVLTFDVASMAAAPSSTRAALPDASIPDKSVCLWGLNATGANDAIITKTFGTAPNRQHHIMFASCGVGATNPGGSYWSYWMIILEETTNKIYLVDARTYNVPNATVSMGIQIDGSTAILNGGSSDYVNTAGEDDTPANNSYFAFVPGTRQAVDMEGWDLAVGAISSPGNQNFTGVIKNNGTAPVTSLTMNYSINGAAPVSAPLTGLNIAVDAFYNFTHPTAWNAVAGVFDIEVWASNINGSADGNPGDDRVAKTTTVLSENIQRMPFYEIFTSSTCGPCTPGNINFMNITDTISRDDYVAIKYQQDFPGTGDPYRTAESVSRRNTPYAINSIPRMEIDGGWDGNAQSFVYGQHTDSRNNPATYFLAGEWGRNGKDYSIKVRYKPIVEVADEKLFVAVIEKKTVNNVKTNGETEFHDVMKKMLPDANGTVLPNNAVGTLDSISMTYTFNGNYRLPASGAAANIINHSIEHSVENFYNTEVIAWVQAPNKEVMQAARLTNTENTGSLTENMNMKDVTVSPNPANDAFTVSFDSKEAGEMTFVLVDAMGSVVYNNTVNSNTGVNAISIPTSALSNGIYHMMIFDASNNAHVEKVMIQH